MEIHKFLRKEATGFSHVRNCVSIGFFLPSAYAGYILLDHVIDVVVQDTANLHYTCLILHDRGRGEAPHRVIYS